MPGSVPINNLQCKSRLLHGGRMRELTPSHGFVVRVRLRTATMIRNTALTIPGRDT